MRTELLLVLALVVGSHAAAADGPSCPPVARVLAAHQVERSGACATDTWVGDGERVTLAPGGFLHVESESVRVLCANPSSAAVVVVARHASPALEPGAGFVEAGAFCRVSERALAPPPTAAPAAPAEVRLFVTDFSAHDVDAAHAAILGRLVAVELGRARGLGVSSGDEVRELLREEAERQRGGCSDDASCLAEIAGALGARYVVSGDVSRVGRAERLVVSLVDTEEARVVAREQTDAADLLGMSKRVPVVVANLLTTLRGGERRELPPPLLGRAMEDLSAVGGATLVGTAAGCASLLCAAAPAALSLGLCWLSSPITYFVLLSVPFVTPTLLCLPCTHSLGATAAATGADLLAGSEIGWLRALTSGCVAGGCAGVGFLVSMQIVESAAAFGINRWYTVDESDEATIVLGGVATLVTVVAAGVAGGVAYDLGIGFFGDEPAEEADFDLGASRAPAPRPLEPHPALALVERAQAF